MSSQLNNNNNTHHRRDGGGGDFPSSSSTGRGGGGGGRGRKRLIDVFDAAEKAETASSDVVAVTSKNKNKNDITPITTNKRLKVSVSSSSSSSKSKTTTMKKPLEGVIACLSGLTNDQKTKFHSLIETLGGRYTRVFDLDMNTHLITDGPYGAKYELAKSSSSNTNSTTQQIIHIVSPKWLIECSKNNQRISEKEFIIVGSVVEEDEEEEATECGDENNNRIQNLKKPPPPPPLPSQTHQQQQQQQQQQQLTTTSVISQQIDGLLSSSSTNNTSNSSSSSSCSLFECQNILLLGFDNNDNNDNEIKKKLSILIRRGLGTIYWEMNDVITIMVLSDNCNNDDNNKLRKVINLTTKQHPNLPQVVSPLWIIDCWKQNCLLLPSNYPPSTPIRRRQGNIIIPKVEKEGGGGGGDGKIISTFPTTTTSLKGPSGGGVLHKKKVHPSSQTSTTKATTTTATTDSTIMMTIAKSSSKVFRDCLFTLVRIAPPNYAVDFDSQQQESFIKRHGGQLVTLKLLDALKQDYSTTTANTQGGSNNNNQKQQNKKRRRLCHVVCWGGGTTASTTSSNNKNSSSRKQQQNQNQDWLLINPILSQIYRLDLCDIVFVTPFWLQTCVQIEKRIKPNRIPLIFIPQPYPIRKALLSLPFSNNYNTRNTMTERKSNKKTTTTTTTTDINNNINIAMTGFHWIERIAIINFINAIGGNFHENMNQQTTHLVCKTKATGIKLTKAKQWKIHIVSIDWLYHIAQYGFYGKGHGKGKGGRAGAGVAATKMTRKDDSQSQLQQKSSTTTTKTTNEASNDDGDGGDENDDCGGGDDDATVGCESNFICV